MVVVVGVVVADFGLRPGYPLGVLGNFSGGRGYFRGRPRPRLGGTAGVLGVASCTTTGWFLLAVVVGWEEEVTTGDGCLDNVVEVLELEL